MGLSPQVLILWFPCALILSGTVLAEANVAPLKPPVTEVQGGMVISPLINFQPSGLPLSIPAPPSTAQPIQHLGVTSDASRITVKKRCVDVEMRICNKHSN